MHIQVFVWIYVFVFLGYMPRSGITGFMFCLFVFYFIYLWLCCIFIAACRLSPVAASGGYSSLWCAGFSFRWFLLLRNTAPRPMGFSSCGTQSFGLWRTGSVVVAHRPSCSTACGILSVQELNLRPLHWQVDSQPLDHQGGPNLMFSLLRNFRLFSKSPIPFLHF